MALAEGFELGSVLTAGNASDFTRAAGGARTGGFGLQRNGNVSGAWKQAWDPASTYTPGAGFLYSGWVRTDTGYVNSGLCGLAIVGPAGGMTGYQALIDIRAGQATYQLRKDSTASAVGTVMGPGTANVWTFITMTWVGTTIQAKFYANNAGVPGALLDTATLTDATYSSGFLGVIAFSLASYDDLLYGVAGPAARPAKVWNGSAWVARPVKKWSGSAWVTKSIKVHDGATWR